MQKTNSESIKQILKEVFKKVLLLLFHLEFIFLGFVFRDKNFLIQNGLTKTIALQINPISAESVIEKNKEIISGPTFIFYKAPKSKFI